MGKIVVGVDGSAGAQAALRFALEEARLRGATLRTVFVWSLPMVTEVPAGLVPALLEDFREEAEKALDAALAEVDEVQDPARRVEIEKVVVEGPPARCLVEAAEDADLLVLGSRGRGGFTGLLLGSVSQQCVHHAPCPVVIVPQHKT
jgi:nucleotide-binding universal stress UspA family protein